MFDQNFRASSIVMSSRTAGTHSIHHGLNDFIERASRHFRGADQSTLTELLFVGIFRFGNAVSKRGLQVYIDLLEGITFCCRRGL